MEFNTSIKKIIPVLIVSILILFVRSYDISEESLYGDEPYSIFQAQKNLPELKEIFLHDQNPPMHIALLHFWIQIFGISDVSAKMFSVICSLLAGLMLFLFAKKHLNIKTAYLVSFLFLFSNAQQFYATEVRPYALIQLLCILSFNFYFNIIKSQNKRDIIFLFLTNALLLYTHYLTIFIFVVQFLCIWLFLKEDKKIVVYYFISQILVVLAFLPWVNVLLSNIPKEGSFWSHAPSYDDFRWHTNLLMGSSNLFYLCLSIVFLFILLVITNKKMRTFSENFNPKYFIVFILLFIVPIGLDFFIAQYTPVFLTRYILYSSFGLFLLISYCFVNINLNNVYKLAFILPLLLFIFSSFKITQEREDDWKHFVPMVKKMQDENTAIFICASYKFKDFSFYYDLSAFKNYKNSAEALAKKNVYFSAKDEWFGWEKLNFDSINKIIYVQSHNQFEDPENINYSFIISKGFKECDSYKKINTGYTLFVKNNLECNPVKIISKNKNEKCDDFEYFAGIDSNKDTVDVYKTTFEKKEECKDIAGTSSEIYFDGKYSLKLNKNNEYSIGITKPIVELGTKRTINISSFIFCKEGNTSHLVVSVEKENQTLFREELFIPEKIKKIEVWKEINMKSILPNNLPKDAILKIYFWNPSENNFYVDKLNIILQ